MHNWHDSTFLFLFIVLFYIILVWRIIFRNKLTAQLLLTTDTRAYRGLSLVYWLSPLFFLSLWGLLTTLGSPFLKNIPTPFEVIQAFLNLLSSGELIVESLYSLQRVLIGFILASLVGVATGLLAGTFLFINHMVVPLNSFLRYIPPTAFISLLIVYFGVDETFKYAVIFLGLLFFIVQMVIDVVDDIDMRYIDMGKTSGFSNWEIFRQVIVPFAWPRVFDVLRINLSAAWTFLVAAEIIGAEKGLGHLIAVSQRFLRLGDLYAGILTFGIIGLITDKFMESLSKRLFKWFYIELQK